MYYERSLAPTITPVVMWLIIINVALFIAQVGFAVAGSARLPVRWLGLDPAQVADFRLWQLVTYMFLHSVFDPLHILFNMLFLYWFGRDIEVTTGSRRFLAFYLAAGIVGGLAFCATYLLLPFSVSLIGASGAIMGVMVLYACRFPDRIILAFFLFPMKVKWFVLILVGVDLIIALSAMGAGALAHLGGAAFGFAYARAGPALDRRREVRRTRRESVEAESELDEERMLDGILEKVRERGMQALTRREKKFLQEMSRKISGKR